jgi:5-deoxy-glucuronate isomerase
LQESCSHPFAGDDQAIPSEQGFGPHRTYTGGGHEEAGLSPIDLDVQVRTCEVTVTYGYHGPLVAALGYPMYYLDVLAGPAQEWSGRWLV